MENSFSIAEHVTVHVLYLVSASCSCPNGVCSGTHAHVRVSQLMSYLWNSVCYAQLLCSSPRVPSHAMLDCGAFVSPWVHSHSVVMRLSRLHGLHVLFASIASWDVTCADITCAAFARCPSWHFQRCPLLCIQLSCVQLYSTMCLLLMRNCSRSESRGRSCCNGEERHWSPCLVK